MYIQIYLLFGIYIQLARLYIYIYLYIYKYIYKYIYIFNPLYKERERERESERARPAICWGRMKPRTNYKLGEPLTALHGALSLSGGRRKGVRCAYSS